MQKIVTSRQNPQVKRLAALLGQKKAREDEGRFVLEGARLCLDAHRAGIPAETLFVTPAALSRVDGLSALVDDAQRVILLDEELAGRIADTEATQGIFAVCPIPAPVSFVPRVDGRYLLLHAIRDPGNLGSVLRSAAALGVCGVVLSECAELWSPKALRASMGGVWRVPVHFCEKMEDAVAELQEAGVRVLAAALRDGAPGPEVLTQPGGKALLLGNEGAGLPDSLIEAAGEAVMIPMRGACESLGVAVAAGILLYQLTMNKEQ